jgi:hypothetical protein
MSWLQSYSARTGDSNGSRAEHGLSWDMADGSRGDMICSPGGPYLPYYCRVYPLFSSPSAILFSWSYYYSIPCLTDLSPQHPLPPLWSGRGICEYSMESAGAATRHRTARTSGDRSPRRPLPIGMAGCPPAGGRCARESRAPSPGPSACVIGIMVVFRESFRTIPEPTILRLKPGIAMVFEAAVLSNTATAQPFRRCESGGCEPAITRRDCPVGS